MSEISKVATSTSLTVRGVPYHVRRWGAPDAPGIVVLHGSKDGSWTFQFLVDALTRSWSVSAPDWRGHGRSGWTPGGYWLHDFVSDLDRLLDELSPDGPATIVGHSLGGNVAGLYAGLRPDRVKALVSLDGFGPPTRHLGIEGFDLLRMALERGPGSQAPMASFDGAVRRLMRANPRLTKDRAVALAADAAELRPDGSVVWRHDPSFGGSLPSLRTIDEWHAIWRRIEADVLWVASTDPRPGGITFGSEAFERRRAMMPTVRVEVVPDTSHNLHHDAPNAVATLVEAFLPV
jgi:pimeloyl-ACP methyl ester carboxylesterase